MAIIERPATESPASAETDDMVTATSSYGYLRRPVETTGVAIMGVHS